MESFEKLDIENAIFQDLESFGKGAFFKMAMEKFWIFEIYLEFSQGRILKISHNGYSFVSYEAPYVLCMFILLFIIQNTIHQKIIKHIKNNICLLFWGFEVQMKMSFMVLEILLFGFGKVLEIF